MKTLGKFEILEKIGQGAMGVVYKARDPLIGRLVALKTISSGLAEDSASLERFYQEARAAGTLQHPNIVTIFELGKEDETPFIAMEFLEGASLDKAIAARLAIPLSQKLGYIVHVCRAIEYAHKRGVVHRDIKPGNVMLTNDGTVKVVDFGIARLAESSRSQSGMLIGTLAYMSPQQIKGAHADATSDIWAAGVMFYEFISYRPPFEGHNYGALMMNILTRDVPPLPEVDPPVPLDVRAVVERMLRKEASERFQSMEEVLIELEPCWKRLQQGEVSGLVADAQQLLRKKDLERALQLVRRALQIDSENTVARDLLEKINAEARQMPAPLAVSGADGLLGQSGGSAASEMAGETLPPDANVSQLLRQAAERRQSEAGQRGPGEMVRALRALIAKGKLDDAAITLRQAVELGRLSESDAEVGDLKQQIEAQLTLPPIPNLQARSAAAAAAAGAFAIPVAEGLGPHVATAGARSTPVPVQSATPAERPLAKASVPVEVHVGATRLPVAEPPITLRKRPVFVTLLALAIAGATGVGVYLLRARTQLSSAVQTSGAATVSNSHATAAGGDSGVSGTAPVGPLSVDLGRQQQLLVSRAMEAANGAGDYPQAIALLRTAHDLKGPMQDEIEKYMSDYQRLSRLATASIGKSPALPVPAGVPAPAVPGVQSGMAPSPAASMPADAVGPARNEPASVPVATERLASPPVPAPPSPPASAAPAPPVSVRAEEPVAPARSPESIPVPAAAAVVANSPERQAITAAIQQLSAAFSHRSMSELQEVWPKVGGNMKSNLKTVFDTASFLTREFHVQSLTIANDGATATVIGTYDGTVRLNRGAETSSNGNFYVRVAKRNNRWYIDDASF